MWVILLVGTGKCKKFAKEIELLIVIAASCVFITLCVSPDHREYYAFYKCSYSTTAILQSIMKNQLLWSWRARLHGDFNPKLSD